MPRAKAKIATGSPRADLWPRDPEEAMREIAIRHNAVYVEGSLVFVPGGHFAEALFETVEPEPDTPATRLHQLGRDLDAIEVTLYFDPTTWLAQRPTT